jgi:hypothetical protein
MAHQKITEQIELMHKALQYQRDIDTITKLVKPVDEITYKVMRTELQEKYLTTMQDLFANLLIVANVV